MATPQPSRKLKRPATSAVAPAVPTDNYGTAVPLDANGQPAYGTPEYSAWHASNLKQQGSDVSSAPTTANLNQMGSDEIATDLERRSTEAAGGFQSSIAGVDLGGQFSTTQTPSTNQTAAGYLAAAPGTGAAGFAAPIAPARPVVGSGVAAPTGGFDLSNKPGTAPSKVETAVDQAENALGPAPQVDIGLADRRLGEYQESLGMSREVIDRLLNGPNTANAIGARVLENQLAVARSARGGPGAVQQAMSQAIAQSPELQAQAAQQAQQEELAKLTAAGNVASNFAQAALGARSQDVDIAKTNVSSGLAVKDMVATLTGIQLELDQRNTELIGQMARDLAALQFDWGSLTAQQASAALDRYLQIYGIDANVRASLKQAAAGKEAALINGIIGGVGAVATVAATAYGGPAAGMGAAAATGAAQKAATG